MKKKHNAYGVINELEESGFFSKEASKDLTKDTSKDLHKDAFKDLSKDAFKENRKDLSKDTKKDLQVSIHPTANPSTNPLPPADVVEEMMFRLRKVTKVRVNGDMPEDWKKEMDEYAHQAGIGRYSLVMYAVGKMLGKV